MSSADTQKIILVARRASFRFRVLERGYLEIYDPFSGFKPTTTISRATVSVCPQKRKASLHSAPCQVHAVHHVKGRQFLYICGYFLMTLLPSSLSFLCWFCKEVPCVPRGSTVFCLCPGIVTGASRVVETEAGKSLVPKKEEKKKTEKNYSYSRLN